MSFNDVYEFIQGEYQQVTRIRQEPVSTADPTFFKDLNLVKWAGYSNEIWSAETGGTQLVQGLDYELQYLDVAASGPAGEPVYSGYSILTPLYYNIPLFQTAAVVGAYTQRPYRPSYNVITTDTTVTPVSMDDSVIADASAGNIIIKLEDGFHLNQRYSIICKGTGTVTVGGTGIGAGAAFQGVGVSWLWDGGEWMPLAAPGAREGGFYYDYVPAFIRPDTDPISATIPNFLATYGEGFFYIGLEFTYQGTTDKTNGTFAIADDGIDKYAVLAVDIAGGDSTLSIQWQWATDTMVAIERGTDFTDLNLWAVFRWEKVTYGGYGAWANTAEAPTYGEPIVSGQELYLDGTKEFVSSSGNAPVMDVVDYLPAVINVDGSETPEPASKWPGQRGTYGFFGEYENLSSLAPYTTGSDTLVAIEGDWIKVEATADAGSNEARISYTNDGAIATRGYIYCEVRRGNTPDSRVRGSQGGVLIYWDTGTFDVDGTDLGCEFISDDIAIVKIMTNSVGNTITSLNARNYSTYATGDYTYYRNFMIVDLEYTVPYQAGIHQPAKLQYSFNWAESTDWTIQGWLKTDADFSTNRRFMDTRANVGEDDGIGLLTEVTTGELVAFTKADGTGVNIIGDPITIGAWEHFKFIFTSETQIDLYQNGVLTGSGVASIPLIANIRKSLYLGYQESNGARAEGYLADWTIQPGIDISDAHYLSGLPYYNPNKTYGKNASWSIDARGNISGNTDAKDWVQKYSDNGTLSNTTIANTWGTGIYIVRVMASGILGGASYTFDVESLDLLLTMRTTSGAADALNIQHTAADNFLTSVLGTVWTNPYIASIKRWE